MKRFRVNFKAASAATFGLVLAGMTLVHTAADAQRGPDSYPYCALDGESATVCYFDSRATCSRAGIAGCIDNPGFNGGNAMARATVQRSHKPRQ